MKTVGVVNSPHLAKIKINNGNVTLCNSQGVMVPLSVTAEQFSNVINNPLLQINKGYKWLVRVMPISNLGAIAKKLKIEEGTTKIVQIYLLDFHGTHPGSVYYFSKEELVTALLQPDIG